ncbi:sensor histidine kinase [Clostridium saccharobutylicum]|uniref:histidine kinase n=1 Tax=Clostridium saccharobutylicum DSM 13864 TaxID=1345695 RepID=U5MY75_CLOSA|nr:HAMP domain-containing sensor histidine kinase [Clostridium saccharobutylicum]AGX44591.1 sensor histidine kinase YclK [Clostridium saccharobutylicum DSM 13864]AQR91882.1 signal transduction histidine-protein kinase ArlS [Clostridium saccharobutylicum]AQS01784.1 signal transduction histidine-protein kinase ArlS [Clostridium saccharobutylicum]AQS15767.1 signal transduction histidine-protein kinase ArlS [Clostridium saccharobutylicum]MBA2906544.1 signal transduction histidine kinase [Clostridi
MKLWLKIYLFSLILLVLTLNLAGFILIQKLHNNLLEKEVDKCLSEQKSVASQLRINSLYMQKIYSDTNYDINLLLGTLMDEYNNSTNREPGQHGDTEILDSKDNILFSDMKFPVSNEKEELENLSVGKINYIIRTVDYKQYLYVSSLVNVYNSQVKVHYAKDISSIYVERMNQYTLFMKLDVLICSLFAVFMFFISRLITKPINTLIASTQKISQGQYSERVKIKSKDEFNMLSNNFNVMAQTIEDKINELEMSNIEKETFINNLTHELKTPLTSIIGYANLIRTSKYNEELFFEASDYIYKEGKRLEQIAFKMMDLIYAKTQEIKLIPERIMPIVLEVKKSVSVKLKDKDIDLIIEGEDCILNMDKDLIKMALCNLIENAIKASENNSKINLKVSNLNDKTIIFVRDSGSGISKEHLDKIWQPFYVVDKARSRKSNGAGIGLSICKKIAEVHKADIKINSELGKGTEVNITFTN